jgi:hypothetical protein
MFEPLEFDVMYFYSYFLLSRTGMRGGHVFVQANRSKEGSVDERTKIPPLSEPAADIEKGGNRERK